MRARSWAFFARSFPTGLYVLYEVLTLRNLVSFLETTSAFGFSGERFMTYESRQVFLNPLVRLLDNLLWPFERCGRTFLEAVTGPGLDKALGIFLYHVLDAIVVDVVVGGAFWWLIARVVANVVLRKERIRGFGGFEEGRR